MRLAKRFTNTIYLIELQSQTKNIIILSNNKVTKTTHHCTNVGTQIKKFKRNGYIEITGLFTYEYLLSTLKDEGFDDKGLIRAQKAYPYEIEKAVFPCIVQRKYNGVRVRAQYTKPEAVDLFSSIEGVVKLYNKTGIPLSIPHLEQELTLLYNAISKIVDIDTLILDGELYIHGVSVGQINGASVNNENPHHKSLTMVVFDIVNLQQEQSERLKTLNILKEVNSNIKFIEITESIIINNVQEVIEYRDKFIEEGYEGVILRNPESLYQPRRTYDMLKYKKTYFQNMKILNVIPNGKYKKQGLLVLFDEEYNNTIECSIATSFTNREYMLTNKEQYINKYITVEYRERTPDGKVFHAVAKYDSIFSSDRGDK